MSESKGKKTTPVTVVATNDRKKMPAHRKKLLGYLLLLIVVVLVAIILLLLQHDHERVSPSKKPQTTLEKISAEYNKETNVPNNEAKIKGTDEAALNQRLNYVGPYFDSYQYAKAAATLNQIEQQVPLAKQSPQFWYEKFQADYGNHDKTNYTIDAKQLTLLQAQGKSYMSYEGAKNFAPLIQQAAQ